MKRPGMPLNVMMLLASALFAGPAEAQSMSPMRGEITSFTDEFAVRVFPQNPYRHRIKVAVRVYDEHFRPVKARVTPREMTLAPENSRAVVVVIPFEGQKQRRVRVCTESVPFPMQKTRVRAQVCGRFIARQQR